MDPIAIDTELHAADYLRLTLWAFFRNGFVALFYGVNLVALIAVAPGILSGRAKALTPFQIAFQAFIWIGLPCFVFLSSLATFRRLPPAQRSIRYKFTNDAIETVTGVASSTVSWVAIRSLAEASTAFYLSAQKNLYQIIPKRAFKAEADMERFREMAWTNLGRKAKLKRARSLTRRKQ